MKTLLCIAALLLAGAAQAQSIPAYDLTAFAGFNDNGETIDINYSYQLAISNGYYASTDLSFSVADSGGNTWTLEDFGGGTFLVSDGPLQFDSSVEACCDAINIDQELYGPQGPTGQFAGFSWSATPVAMPEAPLYWYLIGSIMALSALKLYIHRRKQ